MRYRTDDDLVARSAPGRDLVHAVIDRINDFTDGRDVDLDFVTHQAVGDFCRELGIGRNWAELSLDDIAPTGEEGVNVVPEDETIVLVSVLKHLLAEGVLAPEADGAPAPTLLNDFLPEGETFRGRPCLGHLWELRYGLAVELEHGVTRGTNVTQNHPLLTGLVVMAHLAEDSLYYARLWVMESEGELLQAELEGAQDEILSALSALTLARKHLAARIDEKIQAARAGA